MTFRGSPSGVWIEYWWPKPGEKKGYVVGAGIYDDKATIAELSKLSSAK